MILLLVLIQVEQTNQKERIRARPDPIRIILSGDFDVWQAPISETPVFYLEEVTDEPVSNPVHSDRPAVVSSRVIDRGNRRDSLRLTESQVRERLAHYGATGVLQDVFVAQLKQESGFQTQIISKTGDRGIAQINKAANPNIKDSQALDPEWALAWYVRTMQDKVARLGLRKALAAYNAGEAGMRAGRGFSYADRILKRAGQS